MATIIAQSIAPGAKMALGYGEMLLQGVEANSFARRPEGVLMSHPAWIYGHLSLYADKTLEMIGRADLVNPDADFTRLFAARTECVDDPAGETYPPMDGIVSRWKERCAAAINAVAETPDERMLEKNPWEPTADRLPTVGAAVAFLLEAHQMMHLGQVSAWRRCMGVGGVM